MWVGRGWGVLLAVVGGVLHGVAFPPFGWWPLASVALTPLVLAVRARGAFGGLVLGWVAGTAASTIVVVPWLSQTAHAFFAVDRFEAFGIACIAAQVFGAWPIAIFGVVAGGVGRRCAGVARALLLAAAWIGLEWARSHVATGMPWALLGHSLWRVPVATQIADLGGAYAVSFVLAVVGTAVAEAVSVGNRRALGSLVVAGALVGATLGYGVVRLGDSDTPRPTVRVAMVQGNVPQAWRNDPGKVDTVLDRLLDLTRETVAARPDLIVWPESALNVVVEANPRLLRAMTSVTGSVNVPLVFGAPRTEQREDGRVAVHNSAHVLAPDGRIVGQHDKRHLVPWAEYAPWGGGRALAWRAPGLVGYVPGNRGTVLPGPVPIGILVCFEAIFPALAADLVTQGAALLVNVSDDAWFATAGAREQHVAAVVFRAIETRRAIVRVTNGGITGVIDPWGRLVARYPVDVSGAWVADVPVAGEPTFD